jgi:hypothetical protein
MSFATMSRQSAQGCVENRHEIIWTTSESAERHGRMLKLFRSDGTGRGIISNTFGA